MFVHVLTTLASPDSVKNINLSVLTHPVPSNRKSHIFAGSGYSDSPNNTTMQSLYSATRLMIKLVNLILACPCPISLQPKRIELFTCGRVKLFVNQNSYPIDCFASNSIANQLTSACTSNYLVQDSMLNL